MSEVQKHGNPKEESKNSSKGFSVVKRFRKKLKYNRWIVKNIPFYLFAAVLTVLYIANGHYADKMIRDTSRTEKNLKEMEYEFKIVKRDVIFRSKQSELARTVEPLGLQELTEPPFIINDTIR